MDSGAILQRSRFCTRGLECGDFEDPRGCECNGAHKHEHTVTCVTESPHARAHTHTRTHTHTRACTHKHTLGTARQERSKKSGGKKTPQEQQSCPRRTHTHTHTDTDTHTHTHTHTRTQTQTHTHTHTHTPPPPALPQHLVQRAPVSSLEVFSVPSAGLPKGGPSGCPNVCKMHD